MTIVICSPLRVCPQVPFKEGKDEQTKTDGGINGCMDGGTDRWMAGEQKGDACASERGRFGNEFR